MTKAKKPPPWKRYTSSRIHWLLICATEERREGDKAVADDGWVAAQALFCPYYVNLEGSLGSDWGVIVNPESTKFGEVVFEHEWCGCPGAGPDQMPDHGSGYQRVDEWLVPKCPESRIKKGTWQSCEREKDHAGRHSDHVGRTWTGRDS